MCYSDYQSAREEVIMESSYQSLISVAIGAIIGFFVSIGFDTWKNSNSKRELRNRLIDEFELIQTEIEADLEGNRFSTRAYPVDTFVILIKEIALKLTSKQYRAVVNTYQFVQTLSFPIDLSSDMLTTIERNKVRHEEAIKRIDQTIKLLRSH
jgi:hypothetical protein